MSGMSNGTCSYSLRWTDGDGRVMSPASLSVLFPYCACSSGVLSVPAGASSGAEIDLVLPGSWTNLTAFVVENQSGQELGMAYGGNFAPSLPAGGMFAFAFPAAVSVSGRAITGWRFFLTQNQSAEAGVNYWAWGS